MKQQSHGLITIALACFIFFSPQGQASPPANPKQGWQRIPISGVGSIDMPPSLEVQAGELRRMSNSGYSLILQQRGLNAQIPESLNSYVRVMVETFHADRPGDYHKAGTKIRYSKQELDELSIVFRMQAESPGITILTWDDPAVVQVNGMTAIHFEYSRRYNTNAPAQVSIYVFEDFDRLHKLTLSYRVMESDKWAADLQAVLKSFRIAHN